MLFSGSLDTIIALSSGLPPSGVAVIRISGPAAGTVADAFAAMPLRPRRAHLRAIHSPVDGTKLDDAICLWFPAPASATGEDTLEFHCHGGPALVERVLADAVTLHRVRAAEPGEFTMRAVLNGRMGLSEAEALGDLIHARSEAERRRATRLADGALSRALSDWRARLIAALALCEAHLDFTDEGDVPGVVDVNPPLIALAAEIEVALGNSIDAEKLTDGFVIALVGPPNAGKSSLFNAIVGLDRALVSDEAGTTRDVVTAELELAGFRVILADTAGQRAEASGVEAMGIARSGEMMRRADLVLEVRSPDTVSLDPPQPLAIAHKSELAPAWWQPHALARTSLSDPASIEGLRARLTEQVREGLAGAEAALITRARQRSALQASLAGLHEAIEASPLEVKAEGLRHALGGIARVTGEVGVEDVLDDVFGRFCIGK
ncbi:MAG: tRNA uridine-5-carboxymethylaminomethyl(34) synthesis GTPase MnmE [Pseudomonadota bacterium]